MRLDSKAEIEDCEDQLRRAMLTSDVAALEQLLAPEAVFIDQVGARVSREQDLAIHRSGLLALDTFAVRERDVRLIGDSAIVWLTVELGGRYSAQPFGGVFAYTRVWHRSSGRWRIEAAQCSAVPSA